jgi:hypothetical protein
MECKPSLSARRTSFDSYIVLDALQFENSLRRHNHVGLVHALLLGLAKAGKLSSAQEGATKTMQARVDKQKATEEEMDED